jgi:rhomboid protease GluP
MANCIRCGRQLPPLSFRKVCQWCVQHEAAQRGEESGEEKQHVMPAPWVRKSHSAISLTQVLFGANIAVFIAMLLATGDPTAFINPMNEFPRNVLIPFGANAGFYTLSGQWWRLVTYMFLHGGLLHIGFNMWCLWDLGGLSESLYGRWTYAAIYLITGIAGGLASVAWNPGVLSVGASGAIFGLAGALIASFYLGEFSLPSVAIGGTLRSLIVFAVFNLGFGGMFPGVDNAAHIGGLVSGLILGALIAKLSPQQDAPLRRAGVVGVVALALLAAGFGVRSWRGGPMRMARGFEELGENADPAARYQVFLKEHPDSASAHFDLAGVYLRQQKFSEAEAEYKRVLQLKPEDGAARFYLGLTYLNEKRPEDAKSAFTALLAQNETNAIGHYGLGLVQGEQQKYQAAIDEFKAAAEKDPSLTNIYEEIGRSYAKLGRYDDAIASYLKEKETSGDTPRLEGALAEAYQAKGMNQQAQDARDRAEQLKSGSAR